MRCSINISTHTPHAGRDAIPAQFSCCCCNFYSHAPCGARQAIFPDRIKPVRFLLTRPMRGATTLSLYSPRPVPHFYSHAPCGARHRQFGIEDDADEISTHTPHAGRDKITLLDTSHPCSISTHTPHAGRDTFSDNTVVVQNNFYSHAPCGARPSRQRSAGDRLGFLLTRPMRGATVVWFFGWELERNFYSHAPCGARHPRPVLP